MKPLAKINVNEYNLNRIQDNVDACFGQFVNSRILDGTLIKDVSLTSAVDNVIVHGMDKNPSMVIAGAPNVQATVWKTAQDSRTITLRTSATCICSLWVF